MTSLASIVWAAVTITVFQEPLPDGRMDINTVLQRTHTSFEECDQWAKNNYADYEVMGGIDPVTNKTILISLFDCTPIHESSQFYPKN